MISRKQIRSMPSLYWDRVPDPTMLDSLRHDRIWKEAAISFLAEGVLRNDLTQGDGNPIPVVGAILGNAIDAIVTNSGKGWDPSVWFFRLPVDAHEELLGPYQKFFEESDPDISIGWLFVKYLPERFPFCRRIVMRFHSKRSCGSHSPIHDNYEYHTQTLYIDIWSLENANLEYDHNKEKSDKYLRCGKKKESTGTGSEFNIKWLDDKETAILNGVWNEAKKDETKTGQFVHRLRRLASTLTNNNKKASAVGFPLKASLGEEPVLTGVLWLVYQASWNEIKNLESPRLESLERNIVAPLSLRLQSCLLSRQTKLRSVAEIRAAAAAIMARNKSHNIGSHVTPRSKLEDLRTRVEELLLPIFRKEGMAKVAFDRLAQKKLSPDERSGMDEEGIKAVLDDKGTPSKWRLDVWESRAFPILQGLRDALDDYAQRKDEFVAEFSTDPLISTRAASFYREVILPFIQNTGLTDALAANEDFRYTWDTKPGIVVRCFVEAADGKTAKEIEPKFHPELVSIERQKELGVAIDSPPYGMRFANKVTKDAIVDLPADPVDPRVALPGPVGEMAFYGILENIIRNAAKHGGRGAEGQNALEVHVVFADKDSDHYEITIYENLTGPEAKLDELQELMQRHITTPIITVSGQCRTEAWGTAEMKLCADLLFGATPGEIVPEEHALKAQVISRIDSETAFRDEAWTAYQVRRALAYTFSIRKAWTAVFLGFSVELDTENALKLCGFRFEHGKKLVDDKYIDLPPAFQFAVLHAGLFKDVDLDDREKCDQLRRALRRLPFRVIVCGLSPDSSAFKCLSDVGVCCTEAKIASFQSIQKAAKGSCKPVSTGVDATAERLTHWLWQMWLNNLRRSDHRKKMITTDLYFDQESVLKPTCEWKKQAEIFRHSCPTSAGLNLQVWARTRSGPLECLTQGAPNSESEAMRVIIDRHGEFVSDKACGELSDDDCFVVIDKASSDFETLYNASFNAPWQLPYQLAEAGLLRVLVLDERIAQRAGKLYAATEKSRPESRKALTGSTATPPDVRDVARRAGVGIVQRLVFHHINAVGEETGGWLLDVAVRKWRPIKNDASGVLQSFSADYIEVELRHANGSDESEGSAPTTKGVTVPKGKHLVVVHQGIIDLIKDRYGRKAADGFVEKLAEKHWAVIESGRGIPPEVQLSGEKFLSFSLIDRAFHGNRVAKLGLIRHLMEVTRNRKP